MKLGWKPERRAAAGEAGAANKGIGQPSSATPKTSNAPGAILPKFCRAGCAGRGTASA
jgi:hypothetical protein